MDISMLVKRGCAASWPIISHKSVPLFQRSPRRQVADATFPNFTGINANIYRTKRFMKRRVAPRPPVPLPPWQHDVIYYIPLRDKESDTERR
jgi:hypothetical protein